MKFHILFFLTTLNICMSQLKNDDLNFNFHPTILDFLVKGFWDFQFGPTTYKFVKFWFKYSQKM